MTPEQKDAVSSLNTIRDFLRWGQSQFQQADIYFGHGTDNAWDEAVFLVTHGINQPWDMDPSLLDCRLTQAEKTKIVELITRRIEERIPAPYLTGEAWFCGMPFFVDNRVLVPRSPIGELIQHGFQPWLEDQPIGSVLDLCCGSGCIGIASAMAFEDALVDLGELSKAAISVAKRNIQRHGLEDRVQIFESDLFESLSGRQYDLIVTNPPYVDKDDVSFMPEEYRHEPAMGLGSGDDGLDITRRILAESAKHLNDGGILVCEVGNSEVHLQHAFPEVPFIWVDFEHGGHGVFVLTKEQLRQYFS